MKREIKSVKWQVTATDLKSKGRIVRLWTFKTKQACRNKVAWLKARGKEYYNVRVYKPVTYGIK